MKGFDTAYNIRPETNVKKWANPTTYIGADSAKFQVLDIGQTCCSMSSNTYIKESIKNLELELDKSGQQLFKTAIPPIKPGY